MEDRVWTQSPAGCSGAASPPIQPQQACGTVWSHDPCVQAGLGDSHQPRALLAWHEAGTLHRPQEKWGQSPALRSHQGQHHAMLYGPANRGQRCCCRVRREKPKPGEQSRAASLCIISTGHHPGTYRFVTQVGGQAGSPWAGGGHSSPWQRPFSEGSGSRAHGRTAGGSSQHCNLPARGEF